MSGSQKQASGFAGGILTPFKNKKEMSKCGNLPYISPFIFSTIGVWQFKVYGSVVCANGAISRYCFIGGGTRVYSNDGDER